MRKIELEISDEVWDMLETERKKEDKPDEEAEMTELKATVDVQGPMADKIAAYIEREGYEDFSVVLLEGLDLWIEAMGDDL